jgi:hypothetical protein
MHYIVIDLTLKGGDNMNFSGQSTLFAGDKALYIYSIDKDGELLKMNYDGISKFFSTLDKLGGRKSFGKAMILFDGYNDVPDELHEIPEVRKYVKGLFERFPHLLYYVNFDLEGHHVLLASLLDFQSMYQGQRLTPEELWNRYRTDKSSVPRHQMFLSMPRTLLQKLQSAVVEHGYMMKREDLGAKLAYKLGKMFPLGGVGTE